MKQDPLFPAAHSNEAPLSKMYGVPAYRASAEEKPKWSQSKSRLHCDECAAVQHETRGEFGPRMQAKERRTFVGGPALRLCRRHANSWRRRDEGDMKPWPVPRG